MYFRTPQYKEFQVQGLWGLVQLSWQTFSQGTKKFTYPHRLGVITRHSSNTLASVSSSIDIMIQRPVGLISRGLCKILLWVYSRKRQGSHCTYNTLRHICVSLFAIETEEFVSFVSWMYICCCQQCSRYWNWKHCHWNATVHPLCCTTYVAANNMELVCVFHVNCSILLSDFNHVWTFSTDFHKGPQYQISWKSLQLEPCWKTVPTRVGFGGNMYKLPGCSGRVGAWSPTVLHISMAIYVRGTYCQTQLSYWLIIVRFTTCFGPIPGPSSGCITT